jgi:hypothetical protein
MRSKVPVPAPPSSLVVTRHSLQKFTYIGEYMEVWWGEIEDVFSLYLLTLSLTAPCDPLYLTALGPICPIKIGLICLRAVSCRPL